MPQSFAFDDAASQPRGPVARMLVALVALASLTVLGTVFYAVGTLASFLIEGRLRHILRRRSMKRTIAALHGHVIVCGFGRSGNSVSEYQRLGGTPVVAIDSDPAVQEKCDAMGCLFVLGSALEDVALAEAGIERARIWRRSRGARKYCAPETGWSSLETTKT